MHKLSRLYYKFQFVAATNLVFWCKFFQQENPLSLSIIYSFASHRLVCLLSIPQFNKYVVNFVTPGCCYIISYWLEYSFHIHIPNMTQINSVRSFKVNIKSPLFVTLYCHSIQRCHSVLTSPLSPWYVLYKSDVAYIAEKAMAPHSSTLAWIIPWMEEPGGVQSMGSWKVGHDWATSLSLFIFIYWRRKRQPTPVFLPGESQGRRSLVGCRLWGRTESDTTQVT